MNFISNEVVDYISSSIHHLSSYDEIMYVQKYNRCFNNNNLSSFKTIIEKDYLV